MSKIVTLKDVSWVRQGQTILQDINWEVKPGEHWAVLGLNGSGKTSILNIVTGYSFPTTGEVEVIGTRFGKGSILEMRKKIGFVSTGLDRFVSSFNRMRVEDVVVSGKLGTISLFEEVSDQDYQEARALMEELGLGYLYGKAFKHASQGESRRILIARALMAQPELLILDEPCSGLDILAREQVLSMMDQIKERGTHILYVTHYLEEITPAISHVLLIKDGQIVAQGPKEETLTQDKLSQTYQVPVEVHWRGGRPWLSIGE